MELDTYFEGLRGSIEPSAAAVRKAKKSHETLRSQLARDEELSKADPDSYLSGSYARDSALNSIKDVDVIMLIDLDHTSTTPDVVVAWLQGAMQNYYTKVRAQGRSVQVTTESGFDLDIVPSVPISHRDGPVWIPDRDAQLWVASHPKGQIAFGVNKNDSAGGYYKPLVKMIKYWRDRLPSEQARAKSYLLESLVAESLFGVPQSYGKAVVNVLQFINTNYASYLLLNVVPQIADPGYPSVNVAKRWKFSEFSAFMNEVTSSLQIAKAALASEDRNESIKLWRSLFGNAFRPRE